MTDSNRLPQGAACVKVQPFESMDLNLRPQCRGRRHIVYSGAAEIGWVEEITEVTDAGKANGQEVAIYAHGMNNPNYVSQDDYLGEFPTVRKAIAAIKRAERQWTERISAENAKRWESMKRMARAGQ